jgi:alkanesulfonate monooxygenase SsuD/methylene tetrahydromethanopterin reductase-like flavin-dependent oxidoreductase (luciferase family)
MSRDDNVDRDDNVGRDDTIDRPLASGSVSLRLYPHAQLSAPEAVRELRAQAVLAIEAGFDGVMTSEHHGGFAGYMPNPLQAAGWLLEAMPTGWAAACPLLLTLRPPALVTEEVAWLAARFPGRVGLGLAAGSLEADFDIMGLTKDDLTRRFAAGLAAVAAALGGTEAGMVGTDPAVARCVLHPIPVLSAAMSAAAVRRAAQCGVGLLFDSLSTPERIRQLADTYHDAGGDRPCVLVRRAWLGAPPMAQVEEQTERYRGYASAGAQVHWQGEQLMAADDAGALAEGLAGVARRAGVDALNLRVHVPGVSPSAAREQIVAMGDVVTALHLALLEPGPKPSR